MPDYRHPVAPTMMLRPMALASNAYELLIYGDIGDSWLTESVSALSIVQQLQALPATVTELHVRINSFGGSVSDGLAIYNALRRHPARKIVTVDGVALSSASLIAMAGDEVLMPATAVLMIHAPWGMAQGNAQDMRDMAGVLDTFAKAMSSAYAQRSGQPQADMLALLSDGQDHYYTGEQALEAGFATAIIDAMADQPPVDAAAFAAGLDRILAAATAPTRHLVMAAAMRRATTNTLATASGQRAPQPAHTTAATATDGDPTMPRNTLHDRHDDPTQARGAPSTPPSPDDIRAAALAAIRARNDELHQVVAPHLQRDGVQAMYTAALSDPSITVDNFRAQLLNHIGAQAVPLAHGGRDVHVVADEADKFRAAGENAILSRAGLVRADDQNELRGMTLREIARAAVERTGRRTTGLDVREIVAQGFTTTSDFPALLTSTARHALLMGYEEAPETFPLFTRAGTLTDFRPASRAGLGYFSSLDKVAEADEYKYGTFGSSNQAIVLATYGKLFAITRQAIINDDLGAFTDVPRKMGRAAKRTIGDLVFNVLISNPVLSDGVALFHATHKNLLTGSTIDTANVDAMRVAMGTQQVDRRPINIPLRYIIVPKALEGQANLTRSSQYQVNGAANTTLPNIVAGTFDVIADARLDAASPKAWYGSADPAMYDTIEVAYLDGVQQPFLDQKDGWSVDGTEFKVRIDAGVAPLDFRGLAKNPGP